MKMDSNKMEKFITKFDYFVARHEQTGHWIENVAYDDLRILNKQGYAISWLPNSLKQGMPRKVANIERVRYWYCEIDDLSKEEQEKLIKKSPLIPSVVVESKRSYHIYWKAREALVENFKEIAVGLTKYFKADKSTTHPAACLRVPGFFHQKDPNTPFLVSLAHCNTSISYTDDQMIYHFSQPERRQDILKKHLKLQKENDIWETVRRADQRKLLERLSGNIVVRGERYSFSKISGGYRIIVNDKPTRWWIDSDGMIGAAESFSGAKDGGPTVIEWLRWFGHDNKKIHRILLAEFGER